MATNLSPKAQTRRQSALKRLEAKLNDPTGTRQEHQEEVTVDAAIARINAEAKTLRERLAGKRS